MLKSIETALKLSEIREKLNDLNAVESPTDAQQSEERDLLASQKTTEVEYREALTAEGDEHATVPVDGEDREYRALLGRGNVGRILAAFVEHRAVDGAELEIQTHHGLQSNQIPLDLLRLPVEHRAVTTGPTNVGTTEQPAIMPVFASGVGAFLGASRPTVEAGLVAYPVLDQRPDVGGPHTGSESVDETTGSFSSSLLTPGRIQASYFYKRVDAARFPVIDLALRQALNGGLEEKLDQELIAGRQRAAHGHELGESRGGGGDDVRGCIMSAVRSLARRRPVCGGALGCTGHRVGAPTYAHMGNQYRSNNADYSALDALDKKTSGVRVSAHVPTAAAHKQNAVIRLGHARPGGFAGHVERRHHRAR